MAASTASSTVFQTIDGRIHADAGTATGARKTDT
jgi:hypothetical protein